MCPRNSFPYVASPEWTAYWLTVGFFVLTLPWTRLRHPTDWQGLIICLAAGVAWAAWIGSFRIELDAAKLRYRTLFTVHAVQYAAIQTLAAEIALHWAGFLLLVIQPSASGKPIRVNMKPFRRADIALFIDTIGKHNPSVEIDPSLQKLREAQCSIVKARLREGGPDKT